MATIMASLPKPVPTLYWTDSTTTLHWISSQKHWKQYIEHRVSRDTAFIRWSTMASLSSLVLYYF